MHTPKTENCILFSGLDWRLKVGYNLSASSEDVFRRGKGGARIYKVKNYRTRMKDIKEGLNKWRDMLCSWIGRFNIVKMFIDYNLIYRFKTPQTLVDTDKLIPKFMWRNKRPRIAETILKKENEVGGISLLSFKT